MLFRSWDRNPSSLPAARTLSAEDRRGHGFLSTSDQGHGPGDKIEVYTFLHHDEPVTGAVSMALDYESRGDLPRGAMCGGGPLAKVEYRLVTLSRTGALVRANSVLRALDCDLPIAASARLEPNLLPVLRVRN